MFILTLRYNVVLISLDDATEVQQGATAIRGAYRGLQLAAGQPIRAADQLTIARRGGGHQLTR
jgi:hypothetical protein